MSDHQESKLTRADEKLWGLLAEYDSPGALKKAAAKVRDAGFKNWDCYSPFPVHGLDPAMGIRFTILPIIVFCAGATGLASAALLQWWANAYDWPWIVSGKPFFSLPANIPVMFELTILLSVFAAFFGMWALNKLPQVYHPFFKKDRFMKATSHGFFIGVEAADPAFDADKTERLLKDAGATAIEPCMVTTDPAKWRMPKAIIGFIIISGTMSLVPFAFVAKARAERSRLPHYHVNPNMDFQEYSRAQDSSTLLPGGGVEQAWVEGTVARGMLKNDDAFYHGIEGGQWVTEFPVRPGVFEVSESTMARGEQRYGIYCSPCHGMTGHGDGTVQKRMESLQDPGWVQPFNLHQAAAVRQPHGQLFNTISNGIRNMQGYSAQIPEADRWAIVLYVRALQRSQSSAISDLPDELRQKLR